MNNGITNLLGSILIVAVMGVMIHRQQSEAEDQSSLSFAIEQPVPASVITETVEVAPGKVVENPVPKQAEWNTTEGLQDAMAMQEQLTNSVTAAEKEHQQRREAQLAKLPASVETTEPAEAPKPVVAVIPRPQPKMAQQLDWYYWGGRKVPVRRQQLPECQGSVNIGVRHVASSKLEPIHLQPIGQNHLEKIYAYNDPNRFKQPAPTYSERSKCEQAIFDQLNGKK